MTGASGFIGQCLVRRLLRSSLWEVCGTARRSEEYADPDLIRLEINGDTDWTLALEGVHTVVHLAGLAHTGRFSRADMSAEHTKVNVDGTAELARQAARAGIQRLVFLSSIKVLGEDGEFDEESAPNPQDPYSVSKWRAEGALHAISHATGLRYTTIRSPLVYGPSAKANFRMLADALKLGIPLPLGSIRNRRSFVAIDNLVDFIETCMRNPAAENETFVVSDMEDLSTPDLCIRLANAMGRRAHLFAVPAVVLRSMGGLCGVPGLVERLLGSLCVNPSKATRVLGWTPIVDVDEGLRRAVRG